MNIKPTLLIMLLATLFLSGCSEGKQDSTDNNTDSAELTDDTKVMSEPTSNTDTTGERTSDVETKVTSYEEKMIGEWSIDVDQLIDDAFSALPAEQRAMFIAQAQAETANGEANGTATFTDTTLTMGGGVDGSIDPMVSDYSIVKNDGNTLVLHVKSEENDLDDEITLTFSTDNNLTITIIDEKSFGGQPMVIPYVRIQ